MSPLALILIALAFLMAIKADPKAWRESRKPLFGSDDVAEWEAELKR